MCWGSSQLLHHAMLPFTYVVCILLLNIGAVSWQNHHHYGRTVVNLANRALRLHPVV